MNKNIEIIGIYKVNDENRLDSDREEAEDGILQNWQDASLVEMRIQKPLKSFDFGKVTQETDRLDPSNRQVPYNEEFLDDTGYIVLKEKEVRSDNQPAFRTVFFFHHLDLTKPLKTPLEDVPLPTLQPEFPERLKGKIVYWEP